jgi:hypothetical protein
MAECFYINVDKEVARSRDYLDLPRKVELGPGTVQDVEIEQDLLNRQT